MCPKGGKRCCDRQARLSLAIISLLVIGNTVMFLFQEDKMRAMDAEIKSLQQKNRRQGFTKADFELSKIGQTLDALKEALQQGCVQF